jgi:AraC-like DNA-binding protein
VRGETISEHRRLYLLARVVVKRHYRQPLTLEAVATALSSSPRQLQRVYAQFGGTFQEDLLARRMTAAAELLAEQRAISVEDVARLVGYRQRASFALAFRRYYGVSPAIFRVQARRRVPASVQMRRGVASAVEARRRGQAPGLLSGRGVRGW